MSPLAARLVEALQATPRHFHELVDENPDLPWRDLLRAWGEIRAADILTRNEAGQYCVAPPSDLNP